MKKLLAAASALLLAGAGLAVAPLYAQAPAAAQWQIGPWVKGRNYSVGMPSTMSDGPQGAFFEFPTAGRGEVHYVTVPVRSLEGARRISLTYRIDAARGTRFVPQEDPGNPATLSLYFQRGGDSWTARTSAHRWYAPHNRVIPLTPGTHTVSIGLDEAWVAMQGGDARSLSREFNAALGQAANVGFVFGSPSLRGHGVYATGPARFTVLDFRID